MFIEFQAFKDLLKIWTEHFSQFHLVKLQIRGQTWKGPQDSLGGFLERELILKSSHHIFY